MAAESERPPYLNGASGPKGAKESEAASDSAHRVANGNNDMIEVSRPTIQPQGQAMSQVPKLLPNLSTYSAPASACDSAVSSREASRFESPRVLAILPPPVEYLHRLEKAVRTVSVQLEPPATVLPLSGHNNPRLVHDRRRHLPRTLPHSSLLLPPSNRRPMSPVRKSTICHHGRGIDVPIKNRLPRILHRRELPPRRPKNMERSTDPLRGQPRGASVDKVSPWRRFRRRPATHPLRLVTLPSSRQPRTMPGYTRLTKIRLREPLGRMRRVAVTVAATQVRRRTVALIPQVQLKCPELSCRSGRLLHSAPVHGRSLRTARSAI